MGDVDGRELVLDGVEEGRPLPIGDGKFVELREGFGKGAVVEVVSGAMAMGKARGLVVGATSGHHRRGAVASAVASGLSCAAAVAGGAVLSSRAGVGVPSRRYENSFLFSRALRVTGSKARPAEEVLEGVLRVAVFGRPRGGRVGHPPKCGLKWLLEELATALLDGETRRVRRGSEGSEEF